MTLSVERISEILNDLDDYELRWNDWETEFLTGLKQKLEDDGKLKLTEKQIESLMNTYDKYCKKSN